MPATSNLTGLPFIATNSEASSENINRNLRILQNNILSLNTAVVNGTLMSENTWAAVGIEVSSASSSYIRFHDTSNLRSTYHIGSFNTGTADGLNIWDESGQTMIVSFSKQSIRFYQQVVGPVFDVGGALADTLNAATFGTGADSDETRIQAAIISASEDAISRVYVPASMYPYSASSVSFIHSVQLVREGGDWTNYDVLAYGGTPDGLASNATRNVDAFNAAIDAAAEAGGGTVFVPQASAAYRVVAGNGANNVRLKSGVELRIENGAIIEAIPNSLTIYQVVRAYSVDSIAVTGGGAIIGERDSHTSANGGGESGMVLEFRGVRRGIVEGVTLKNGWGDGFYVSNDGAADSEDIHLRGVRIENNRRNNVSIIQCNGGSLTDSFIYRANGTAPQQGVDIEPNNYAAVNGFLIGNNFVSGCSGPGIGGQMFEYCQFVNNHCENNASHGLFFGRCAYSVVQGNISKSNDGDGVNFDSDAATIGLTHFVVTGNLAQGNAGDGFAFDATSVTTLDFLTVTGNMALNNAAFGFSLSHVQNATVEGNSAFSNDEGISVVGDRGGYVAVVANTVGTNTARGMTLSAQSNCIVANNVFCQNGEGGLIVSDSSHCQITGNLFVANGSAANNTHDQLHLLSNSDRNNIQFNTIRDPGSGNRPRYGINIAAATCNDNLVTNNYVQAGATGAINNAGTSTITLETTGNTVY